MQAGLALIYVHIDIDLELRYYTPTSECLQAFGEQQSRNCKAGHALGFEYLTEAKTLTCPAAHIPSDLAQPWVAAKHLESGRAVA